MPELILGENYRNDLLVKCFGEIFSDDCSAAVNSYVTICRVLFTENKTLSDYIFFLLTRCDNPIMQNYLITRDKTLFNAINSDISILSEIAATDAEEIIAYIRQKFSLGDEFNPVRYDKGDTVISTEAIISFSERFGNAVFAYNKAFVYENGELKPTLKADDIRLSDLKNYNTQRKKVIDNTICFINGAKAQNALLYGDRGTGKSSTVKAVVNEYPELRIIQVSKNSLSDIYRIYDIVKNNPLKFVIFIDDITFGEDEAGYSILKQVLEGSVMALPENCIIYATTNRRHIIKETYSERTGDEMHAADARDENMSLADRFGLYITFTSPDKNEYIDIVKQICADRNINIPPERLVMLAERFALKKCGRSPRTARQFTDMLQSRLELGLDTDEM